MLCFHYAEDKSIPKEMCEDVKSAAVLKHMGISTERWVNSACSPTRQWRCVCL